MSEQDFNRDLCHFLQSSPTPFHAVREMQERLRQAGYQRLHEADSWELLTSGRYFVTRNDSALIAFSLGAGDVFASGFRISGAHTDSPCLKIKPQPEISKLGYWQLGVEVYGGALLNPWFDRDLSFAGRVTFLDKAARLRNCLIDFKRPVAVIPSLAIHLDREANQNRSINQQANLPPLLMQGTTPDFCFRELLLSHIQQLPEAQDADRVLDFELSLYDVQPPALVGLNEEFLAGARLDNLLSCHAGLDALLRSDSQAPAMLVCTDHEEVGSVSTAGAGGTFLQATLERIAGSRGVNPGEQATTADMRERGAENFRRMLDRSVLLSVDNAHGIHPNFADKHDQQHGPLLNGGPVLKLNANQRYATNSETAALFRQLCEREDVPLQSFVVRSDMGCGSTIGPVLAGQLGIKTADVGVPTFAMHSIRELAGSRDGWNLSRVLTRFFRKI
ncbi:MAG: M18 family aminopeptidase [Pseudomonadales bacterium]|nr:M18 family aminopeptidase [Pseudomonadales bacterium]